MKELQGWHPDPTGRHQERYFSQGAPTHLHRDGEVEGYDDRADFPAGVRDAGNGPTIDESGGGNSSALAGPSQGGYPDPLRVNPLRRGEGSHWGEQTRSISAQTDDIGPGSASARGFAHETGEPAEVATRFCAHCGAPLSDESGAPTQSVGDSNSFGAVGVSLSTQDSHVARSVPGDETTATGSNGTNGTLGSSAPGRAVTRPPVIVAEMVPSPGWYPVQGSPELLRWWDGSEWGVVRGADPSPVEPPTPSWPRRQ